MSERTPYLSIVATSRNDDHGGNLLGRMQAFVNAFIGQCKRHSLNAELILVEWNPPSDREPLIKALRWPADVGPCRVRIITVPEEIHRRYEHAEALPLYQMIGKNVGIRRAQGEFILATNIDILFSDELMRFLAEKRLQTGRMYRIDRYDVGSDVPVDASVEDQLAYCRTHTIRVNARHGSFNLTPEGLRGLAETDIAAADSGINFGPGWFPPFQYGEHSVHRWVSNDAELVVQPPRDGRRVLALEIGPGPSVGYKPFDLQLLDRTGSVVAETTIPGRTTVAFRLPLHDEEREVFRFRVIGGDLPVRNDPHILNFQVFRCAWAEAQEFSSNLPQAGIPSDGQQPRHDPATTRWPAFWPRAVLRRAIPEDDIVQESAGLVLGAGWCPRESARGRAFRWIENEAELIVFMPEGPPRILTAKVQPGPAVGFKRSMLRVRDQTGQLVASAVVERVKQIDLSLPWRPGGVQVFTFHLESDGEPVPVPGDSRGLRFRMFQLQWPETEPAPWDFRNREKNDIAGSDGEIYWGIAWSAPEQDASGGVFRWAHNDAEIVLQAPEATSGVLRLEIEPGPALGFGPLELQALDARGQVVARGLVRGRRAIHLTLPLCPGRTHVFTLHAEPAETSVVGDPRLPAFRLLHCGWASEQADVLNPDLGLAAGTGWSATELDGEEPFRRVLDGAQLLVRALPGAGRVIELEVEPELRSGAATLDFEVRNGPEEMIAKTLVDGRQVMQFALPQHPASTQTLVLRLAPNGAGAPQLRIFRCEWAGSSHQHPRSARFRSVATLLPPHDIVLGTANIALGKNWYAAESCDGKACRWAANDAEIIIRAQGERLGLLRLEIEPGPSLGNKPFVLQVRKASGQAVYEATISGRKKLEVALFVPLSGSHLYRLRADGADLPLLDDPRTLSFRVFECCWAPAGGPRPLRSPLTEDPADAEIVCPEDLHTFACGDFTLLAREHWLDLRGYPEFDLFSFNLDSVFCYAAHHGGAREEVLLDPLRIYHIEHSTGSGWTPEGHNKLFERVRARGLSYIDWPELCLWGTQMRRLNVPMIFNRENWGLADIELRETVPSEVMSSRSANTP